MNRRTFLTAAAGAVLAPAPGDLDAAAFHAARRFAETPFGRIAYVERGAGPAALFLHGFPLNGFQWRGALPRLAPHRRCIAPDLLGLGFTEPAPDARLDPHAQAEMLVALLDRLGVGAVDLVASDSGGAVAQLLLAAHPDRVRTLLLTNCDAEPDSPPPALLPVIGMAHAGDYPDRWLVPWLADKVLARSPQGLGGMCFSDPRHPSDEAIETYLGPLVATPARKRLTNAYAIGLEANALAGLRPRLAAARAPVRILWGDADTIFSAESPAWLDRLFPASRGVRHLPGAKLFWPEEFPEILAEEALRLWRG